MTSNELGRVVHASPGRIRLRVSRSHRTAGTFAQVRQLLSSLPGVADVDVNAATGSVLVHYDPDTLDVAHLLRLGADLGWIPPRSDDASATGSTWAEWRSQVDLSRAAQGLTVLAVAAMGAAAAPALGLSSRVGSLTAAAAFLILRRLGRRAR